MARNPKYGWRPDIPDHRDLHLAFPSPASEVLPSSVDLKSGCPMIYDQGNLGSCTANAVAGLFQFTDLEPDQQAFLPSRRYLYYNTRVIEGTVNEDSGATIRDTLKAVFTEGICHEDLCSYDIKIFKRKPSGAAYVDGRKHALRANAYMRLDNADVSLFTHNLKSSLVARNPVAFGFSVYESFESSMVAHSGIVPLPAKSEKLLGGHAVLLVGYDDAKNSFLVRNSWGTGWGLGGYFWMGYAYVLNRKLASDFWTITSVPA